MRVSTLALGLLALTLALAVSLFPVAAHADERILITTAGSCDTSALVGWTVVELTP